MHAFDNTNSHSNHTSSSATRRDPTPSTPGSPSGSPSCDSSPSPFIQSAIYLVHFCHWTYAI